MCVPVPSSWLVPGCGAAALTGGSLVAGQFGGLSADPVARFVIELPLISSLESIL